MNRFLHISQTVLQLSLGLIPKRSLFLVFLALSIPAIGQMDFCEGNRFIRDVFTEIDSIKGIKYGQNSGLTGSQEDLLLDIYMPQGDTLDVRPTLILAFGGGFTDGEREDMSEFCRRFARKGFVAATIDYRLINALVFLGINDSSQAINFLTRAFQDVKAAIRFLKENALDSNDWGIDPNNIFVGGVSAGAIAAAHAVYLDSTDEVSAVFREAMEANGGWRGNSNEITSVDSEVRGLISWSGALNNVNWIDPSDPPLFMVHDDADEVVPYRSMELLVGINTFITFQGPSLMGPKAREMGIYTEEIIVKNSSQHVSYFLDPSSVDVDSVVDRTAQFMKALSCGEVQAVSTLSPVKNLPIKLYPNPSKGRLWLDYPLGGIPLELSVYSMEGKLMKRYAKISGEGILLKLPALTRGLYLLRSRSTQSEGIFSSQLFEVR